MKNVNNAQCIIHCKVKIMVTRNVWSSTKSFRRKD